MNYLRLSHEPLDVDSINKIVVAENCGAISMFCGTTRNNFEGKPVVCLEYEAYEPMALKQMQIICDDIRQKWPDVVHIAIYHRLGVVPICKPSVVISISSPHRQSSLQAVTFAIDELKKRVPIWKKEKYENNESTWKENKECKERFNYKENICVNEELEAVPKNLIQISAPEEEISRRIRCFLGKKREEINLSNILDYITKQPRAAETATGKNSRHVEDDGEVVSCARTNSIVIKQEYSSCHLRVSRAENRFGPQKRDYLDKLMTNRIDGKSIVKIEKDLDYTANMPQASTIPFGVLERLETVEEHLNLPKPDDKTIYQRLKSIENRLLYLESISPEYKHFLTQGPQSNSNTLHPDVAVIKEEPPLLLNQKKVCYTVNDIDSMIESIQSYTAPQPRDE